MGGSSFVGERRGVSPPVLGGAPIRWHTGFCWRAARRKPAGIRWRTAWLAHLFVAAPMRWSTYSVAHLFGGTPAGLRRAARRSNPGTVGRFVRGAGGFQDCYERLQLGRRQVPELPLVALPQWV